MFKETAERVPVRDAGNNNNNNTGRTQTLVDKKREKEKKRERRRKRARAVTGLGGVYQYSLAYQLVCSSGGGEGTSGIENILLSPAGGTRRRANNEWLCSVDSVLYSEKDDSQLLGAMIRKRKREREPATMRPICAFLLLSLSFLFSLSLSSV